MLGEFARRREFVTQRLASIPKVSCGQMGGAFYAFVNIRAHLGRRYGAVQVDNSAQWCLALLDQQNVATVMGSAFGAEGYVRISYATSLKTLEDRLRPDRSVHSRRIVTRRPGIGAE